MLRSVGGFHRPGPTCIFFHLWGATTCQDPMAQKCCISMHLNASCCQNSTTQSRSKQLLFLRLLLNTMKYSLTFRHWHPFQSTYPPPSSDWFVGLDVSGQVVVTPPAQASMALPVRFLDRNRQHPSVPLPEIGMEEKWSAQVPCDK